jgi:hypothetical protein
LGYHVHAALIDEVLPGYLVALSILVALLATFLGQGVEERLLKLNARLAALFYICYLIPSRLESPDY